MGTYIKRTLIALIVLITAISGCAVQGEETTTTTERERARERQTTTTEAPTTTTERLTTTTLSENELKQQYLEQMLPLVERLDAAYAEIGNTLNDVVDEIITPEEGAERIRIVQDEVIDIRSEALGIDPPSDFESAHTHFLNGLGFLAQACNRLALGLETRDPSLIDEATNLMEQANTEFTIFLDEIEENASLKSTMLSDLSMSVESLVKNSDSLMASLVKAKKYVH